MVNGRPFQLTRSTPFKPGSQHRSAEKRPLRRLALFGRRSSGSASGRSALLTAFAFTLQPPELPPPPVFVCSGNQRAPSLLLSSCTCILDRTASCAADPEQRGQKGRLGGRGVWGGFVAAPHALPTPPFRAVTETRVVVPSRLSVCVCVCVYVCVGWDRAFFPLLWASLLDPEPQGEHPYGCHAAPARHRPELRVAPTHGDVAGPGAPLFPLWSAETLARRQFALLGNRSVCTWPRGTVVTLVSQEFRGLVLNKRETE